MTLLKSLGLEQSIEAAEEVEEQFLKLKGMSATRFSAYFAESIGNFERRMETNVCALKKRAESKDKKVKEKAAGLLNKVLSKKFFLLNLGILDVYQLLGSYSKLLQRVEQFPWDIPKLQQSLIEKLALMEGLSLSQVSTEGIDKSLWTNLRSKLGDVLDEKYVTAQTTLFGAELRRGRAAQDESPHQSLLVTVQNKLVSLVKNLKTKLVDRITAHPTPDNIIEMGKCLNLEDILSEDRSLERQKNSLKRVMAKAKYCEDEKEKILHEYEEFRRRAQDLMNPDGENAEIVARFEHIIFKTHSCSPDCVKILPLDAKGRGPGARVKVCPEEGSLLLPRKPNLMKLLHLFYKEPSLYCNIKGFLHLYLRCHPFIL